MRRPSSCGSSSQPPLSRQIKELERGLDTPLFDRTKRAVQLTVAGRVFSRKREEHSSRSLVPSRWCSGRIAESLVSSPSACAVARGERVSGARNAHSETVPSRASKPASAPIRRAGAPRSQWKPRCRPIALEYAPPFSWQADCPLAPSQPRQLAAIYAAASRRTGSCVYFMIQAIDKENNARNTKTTKPIA